jgi:hypothetical protein
MDKTFTDRIVVGRATGGFAAVLGEGPSYQDGLVVFTATGAGVGDGGSFVDQTSNALSGTTNWSFQGAGTGNAIYVGTTAVDALSALLRPWGARFGVNTARVGGTIILEIWDGAAWVQIGMQDMDRAEPNTTRGPNPFSTAAGGGSQIRAGILTDRMIFPGFLLSATTQASKAVNGVTAYWLRFRTTVALTTLPQFRDVSLHSSHFDANALGGRESFGEARRMRELQIHQNLGDDVGGSGSSPGNADIDISSTITLAPMSNSFRTGDAIGIVIPVPHDIDPSLPLSLRIAWLTEGTDTGNVRWQADVRILGVGDVADATATSVLYSFDDNITVAPTAQTIRYAEINIDIQSSTPGQTGLAVSFSRNGTGADTYTATEITLGLISAYAFKWQG